MHPHGFTKSRLAAVGAVACLAATVAACSSSSSTSTGNNNAAAVSPTQAVELAAHSAAAVNTFTGTISLQGTYNESSTSGPIDMSGTMSGQRQPSLEFSANIGTFSAAGENIGPMDEVLTSKDLYLKVGMLSQALHTSKPWIAMPISELSNATGVNLSSLLSETQDSSPLTQTQMLAGATGVRKVGTSTIDGVPVTEYSGTITMDKAIAALPGDVRSGLQQEITSTGIKSASFDVWLDGQHQAKKEVITEKGSAVSETITVTMTSVNQPVSITPPAADQVTSVPASVLSGS